MEHSTVRGRLRWCGLAILLAAAAYTAYCFLVVLPPIISITPDTGSYLPWIRDGRLDWWHIRGPGYPLLLIALHFASERLFSVAVAQLAMLTLVAFVLAHAVYKLTERAYLGVLVGALLLLNTTFMWQAMQAMSEALYAALVTLFLAVVLYSARRPTLLHAILLACVAAYATATRPTGYALCASLPFLWFGWRRQRQSLTVVAIFLCGCALALLAAVNYQVRGFWGFQQFTGPYLAIHAVWFMDDDTGSPNPEVTQSILQIAKRYRDGYAEQKTWHARYEYSSQMLPFFLVESTHSAAQILGYSGVPWAFPQFLDAYAPVLGFLAGRTLERHPLAFARHVAEHYAGFWYHSLYSVPPFTTPWQPETRRQYFAGSEAFLRILELMFTTSSRPVAVNSYAFEIPDQAARDQYLAAIDESPRFLDHVQSQWRRAQPILAASTFVLSLFAIGLAVWRWRRLTEDPVLFSLSFASVALHGYALNVALGSPTIPRYTFPYLSVALFILIVGVCYCADAVRSRRS